MWNTRDAHLPQVKWGSIKGVHTHTKNVKKQQQVHATYLSVLFASQATSSTYTAQDMCDTPAMDYGWTDPGMIHKALMDGSV